MGKPELFFIMKTKTKSRGGFAGLLDRAFECSDQSAEQRKAVLETRRNILRKLLLRQSKTKSDQL